MIDELKASGRKMVRISLDNNSNSVSFNPLDILEDEILKREFKGIKLSDLAIICENKKLIEQQLKIKEKAQKYISKKHFPKAYKLLSRAKRINKELSKKSKYAKNLNEVQLNKAIMIAYGFTKKLSIF